MVRRLLFGVALLTSLARPAVAQYNSLWVPDTLTGPVFNLEVVQSSKQLLPGPTTHTHCFEGNGRFNPNGFWGPTLLFEHGDTARLTVLNSGHDTTTVHWHGFDLPPQMDGGPHQPIPVDSTWRPFFQVQNRAGFFWYHPHLHMMTEEQVTLGMGGFIIVRDSLERTLPLPRRYGIDDLPLALTDRRFDAADPNQFALVHYGDTVLTNGILNATTAVPAQVVRLRLLGAAAERSYNVGFSDNRTFWVIANDGGMLTAPVAVTRFLLSAGERVELLVNFGGQQGQALDLVAYNNEIARDVPGAEPVNIPQLDFRNALGARRFNLLHLTVGAPTAGGITAIPTTLRASTFPVAGPNTLLRHIAMSDALVPGAPAGASWFDGQFFDFNRIDQHVTLGATEIWELENQSRIAHPFHIHDVQFYLLARNFQPAPTYEQAWKDVVLVHASETVQFIARFNQEADSLHPFMYHCHILFHEDAGMMGQFTVQPRATGLPAEAATASLFAWPNPATATVQLAGTAGAQTLTVYDALGRVVRRTAAPTQPLDVRGLVPGVYLIRLDDGRTVRFAKEE